MSGRCSVAKIEVSASLLAELLFPGQRVEVTSATNGRRSDLVELTVIGDGVPDAERAAVVIQSDWSAASPAPKRTTTFQAV